MSDEQKMQGEIIGDEAAMKEIDAVQEEVGGVVMQTECTATSEAADEVQQNEDESDVVDVAEIRRMLDEKRGTSKAKEKQAEELKKRKELEEAAEIKCEKWRIPLFLILTFGITYFLEIFMIMPNLNNADAQVAAAAQSMVSSIMFIPAMAALFTRLLTVERMTGRNMYLLLNLKGNLKYYGLSWFGIGLLVIFGAVLYFVIFRKQYDPDMGYAMAMIQAQSELLGQEVNMTTQQIKAAMMQQFILGFVISPFVNIITCFGEEWGWRGYLLPKMLKKLPVVPTLLITGVIWGLWHAPLTVMGHNYGVGYPGFPVVGILAMCIFCTAVGIILSYVTIKTRSCVPAILGHGMLNGFASVGIYYTSIEHPYNVFLGPAPTGLIGGMGFIILAAVLLWKLHKEEKESGQKIVM